MTIGFVSSDAYANIIRQMVETEFSHINVIYFTYEDYTQVPKVLEAHQEECDAIIFSGALAYYYCRANCAQKVMWMQVRPQSSSVAVALKEAMDKGYDVKRLCVNALWTEGIKNACREVGLSPDKVTIYRRTAEPSDFLDPEYNYRIYRFYRRHFEESGATCGLCTNLWVYKRLKAEGYAVVFLRTNLDGFRAAFNETYHKLIDPKEKQSQIVAVMVSSDLSDGYSSMADSDYSYMRKSLQLTEKVHSFAIQIQGIVCDETVNRKMIISTREDFEAETDGFKEFKLFRDLNRNSLENYLVGVGYGVTALSARKNARIALDSAAKNGSNSACLVAADGSVVSMVSYLNEGLASGNESGKIEKLSVRTGLSAAMLQRLIKVIEENAATRYTSNDLAQLMGVSKRNMDRMLIRLENSGFATMVGKDTDGERGRPKRIFELNFDFEAHRAR